ncbi:MAG: dephospho-CoA kinase [Planctomycetota bacterium]|jgi:dephospho-CoA kinase
MNTPGTKPVIGILGGLCSGKSTVAAEFAKLGCAIIDADKIGHELLEEAVVKNKVVDFFGEGILDPEGRVDRKKLSEVVFANGHKLAELNKLLHPGVLERVEQLIKQYNGEKRVKAIVLDMPLLVEVGWAERCDRLVFVDCKPQLRAKRAKKMGYSGEKQLKIRENFQISLDKKAAIADNSVDNNSGFSELTEQVTKAFSYIMDNG